VTQLLLFVLKRTTLARLLAVQSGQQPIPGTDALLSPDVQIGPIIPAQPDRTAIYFAPVRSQRTQRSAESINTVLVESIPLEIRVRVYSPGETDDDVAEVEKTLDDMCNAVARALMDGPPLAALGDLNIAAVTQWPTALQATPEPGITAMASLFLQADLVTS
jgi:hypothetical protein